MAASNNNKGDLELVRKVDELRESLDEELVSQGWAREISIIGLVVGLVAVVFWMLTLEDRNAVLFIAQDPIDVSGLQDDLRWMGGAIEQGTRAQLLAGDRIRFESAGKRVSLGNAIVPEVLASDASGTAWRLSSRLRQSRQRPDLLQLDLELVHPIRATRFEVSLTGSTSGLADLTARGVQHIQAWLKLDPLTPEQQRRASAELPPSDDGRRFYVEARRALDIRDARAALPLLEQADEASPGHPLVNLALAEAWSMLGYKTKAKGFVERAFELRSSLSRELQLLIEGHYRRSTNELRRAQDVYRALWAFYPTDLTYGLALVDARAAGGDAAGALETINELRGLPAPLGEDPRIDLAHALVAWRKGDWQEGLEPIADAVRKARALGGGDLLATALRWQFKLTWEQPDEALLTEAQRLFEKSGNLKGQSEVWRSRGEHARGQGDLLASERYFVRALESAEKLGDEAEAASAMSGLAITMDLLGRLEEGLSWKRRVMASRERRAIPAGVAIARENIGHSLFKLGRLAEARQVFTEAGDEFAVVGDEIGLAWIPYHEARILGDLGQLPEALRAARQARENAKTRPEGSLADHAEFEQARIRFRMGELDEARASAVALIDRYTAGQLFPDAAETRVLLARILRAQGFLRGAEQAVETAIETFADEQADYYLIGAMTERVDQLLHIVDNAADSDTSNPDARLARLCRSLAARESEHGRVRLRARVRTVACRSRDGLKLEQAFEELDRIAAESAELGLFEPRLDALSMRARLLYLSGRHDEADEVWREAEHTARQHAWQQLAFPAPAVRTTGRE